MATLKDSKCIVNLRTDGIPSSILSLHQIIISLGSIFLYHADVCKARLLPNKYFRSPEGQKPKS